MAKGVQYSLAVPHSALLYKVLGEFCAVHQEVKRTSEPWFVVIGWLGMSFNAPNVSPKTRYSSSFIPYIVMISKVECDAIQNFSGIRSRCLSYYRFKVTSPRRRSRMSSISLKYFYFLAACLPRVPIYWHELHIIAKVYHPARFCH